MPEKYETEISVCADSSSEISESRKFTSYKLVSASFYGLLFSLALFLETAYQFDRYAASALWIGVVLTIWNGAAMFVALTSAQKETGKNPAFRFGVFTLIMAAGFSCAAISLFLPFEPITVARFQTQPAFAAFLKNVFLYFLPLGIFFIYAPFFLLSTAPEKLKNVLRNLFGILFLVVVYSFISTFYLLDRLEIGQFHNLFVVLTFLRFIVYFGLALSSLLWVKARLE